MEPDGYDDTAFTGTIRFVPYNFAPLYWSVCDGKVLQLTGELQMLFSLIGNRFGGNGTTNFGLPNLIGRVLVGAGGSLPAYTYGGQSELTLSSEQLPMHTHAATFIPSPTPINVTLSGSLSAQAGVPVASLVSTPSTGDTLANTADPDAGGLPLIYAPGNSGASVNLASISMAGSIPAGTLTGSVTNSNTGGSAPVSLMQPYLALTPVICLQGVYPTRP